MKILVICQYYYPEPFKVHDVCEALVAEGHEVDVVTSFPNYPMGEIYDGYKNGEHEDESLWDEYGNSLNKTLLIQAGIIILQKCVKINSFWT